MFSVCGPQKGDDKVGYTIRTNLTPRAYERVSVQVGHALYEQGRSPEQDGLPVSKVHTHVHIHTHTSFSTTQPRL